MRKKLLLTSTAVLAGTVLFAGPAGAQEAAEAAFLEQTDPQSIQNNLDVLFYLICAALVFFMQAGFAMLEAGMTSSKNASNIMMKNTADALFGIIAFFLVGFGLAYGADVGGLIGTDGWALGAGSYNAAGVAGDPFLAVDFLYQAVFAATAATIVSGAVAGRMKFGGYIVMSVVMTSLIYPIVVHWQWGGGWLSELGFYDFAGSTLVHMTGGVAALVLAAILGPRIGKFAADGTPRAIPGHSIPLAYIGMFILWLGWFGFNGGSVLSADGALVAPVLLTTMLAACAGGAAALVYTWARYGKSDASMTVNGVLAGLVAITAGPDRYTMLMSVLIGLIAGVLVVVSVAVVDRMKIDDAVGAFSVHGTCGAFGTIAVGLFATDGGLLYGDGAGVLVDQLIGVVAVAAYVTVMAAIVGFGLKAANMLRVSETEEIEGLDIHEHGMYAYPEQALGTAAFPAGPVTSANGEVTPTPAKSAEKV